VNQILKIHSVNKVEVFSPYFTGNETDRIYSFEEVFDGQANNRCVFNRTMLMAIENVLHGFNSTVFIYGMTGAGKTYTMFGSDGTSLKPK
jgi:chromosomal replication initiation ATPase DnaA